MLATPNYSWPYPESTDTPDVPRDVKNLALAADLSLAAQATTDAATAATVAAMNPAGMFSRYTGAGTATTLNGWVDLPFVTRADGAGNGLSVASNTTFTLTKPGVWTVEFSGSVNQSGHTSVTGAIFALFSVNTHAANTAYAAAEFGVAAGFVPGCVSAEILTTGTTTVLASVFTLGAASVMDTGGLLLPRLSFSWKYN